MVFKTKNNRSNGFTIVELMIAIAVFSAIIALASSAVIQLGRHYQSGATKTRLLSLARDIQSQIAQNYQYNGTTPTLGSVTYNGQNYDTLCIGTTRYLFQNSLPTSLNTNWLANNFIMDSIDNQGYCNTPTLKNPQLLLPNNARLAKFYFAPVSNSPTYKLVIRFIVGDQDQFKLAADSANGEPYSQCKQGAGSEFCAVVGLTSNITRKVVN